MLKTIYVPTKTAIALPLTNTRRLVPTWVGRTGQDGVTHRVVVPSISRTHTGVPATHVTHTRAHPTRTRGTVVYGPLTVSASESCLALTSEIWEFQTVDAFKERKCKSECDNHVYKIQQL